MKFGVVFIAQEEVVWKLSRRGFKKGQDTASMFSWVSPVFITKI